MTQRVRSRLQRGIFGPPYVPPVENPEDADPDAFAFVDVADADPSTLYLSNIITITGITAAAPTSISTSGGAGEYRKNGGAWTSALGSVVNGDTVQVRNTSSATPGAAVSATLTIGSVSDTFTVTTTVALPAPARAPLTLNYVIEDTGDSTAFGVGAGAGDDPASIINSRKASGSGSVVNRGLSGNTTAQIRTYVLVTATPTQRTHPWIFGGGLNNYNTALGNIHNWPPSVKSDVTDMKNGITGPYWGHKLSPVPDDEADGMRHGADHVWHRRDMKATFGARMIDLTAWLRGESDPDTGGVDYFNVTVNGSIPLSARGTPSNVSVPRDNSLPTIAAGTPGLGFSAGKIAWNSTALKYLLKLGASGAGSWPDLDRKHFGAYGYGQIAYAEADFIAANEGTGAPFASEAELKVAKDVAAGVVGYAPFSGVAEAVQIISGNAGGQFSASLTTQVYSGETQNVVAISRTATGALTEGETVLRVRLGKVIGGVMRTLDFNVRIYVGRASTQTTPRMLSIASPGIALVARTYTPMAGTKAFSFVLRINPDAVNVQQYLIAMDGGDSDSSKFYLILENDARITLQARNSANTLILNRKTAIANALTAGTDYWLLGSVNMAGAMQFYQNETATTWAAGTYIDDTIGFASRMTSRFFALTEPKQHSPTTPGVQRPPVSPFLGDFGIVLFTTQGAIDWSNAANRRALFNNDAGFTPVARTVGAAIGGVGWDLEAWGGPGDILSGTPGALTDSNLIMPSYAARTRLGLA